MVSLFCISQLSAQTHSETSVKPTIYRQAGDYSERHDAITVAVLRGSLYRAEHDAFITFLSQKLDSASIPHRVYQEDILDKPGSVYVYFVENSFHGPFSANELNALIPRMIRAFQDEYAESQGGQD